MEQIGPRSLSNRELIEKTKRLADQECRTTAELVELLAEVDRRRLYAGEGCPSLFAYCTQVLHFSEHAAYGRIEVARLSRRFPRVIDLLADGAVNLTTLGLLAPHLTDDNCDALLDAIRHKSKREVERLIVSVAPNPDIAPLIWRVPAIAATTGRPHEPAVVASPIGLAAEPGPRPNPVLVPPAAARPTIAPLAPERYLIKVTVSAETHAKLRRAQDLLRHVVPDGDPAAIIDRGLTLLVEQLERTKLGRTTRPEIVGSRSHGNRGFIITLRTCGGPARRVGPK